MVPNYSFYTHTWQGDSMFTAIWVHIKSHFLSFSPTPDIDECAESLTSCGAHSQCVNLPGSHRCQCQSGFEFGFDGRTCVGKKNGLHHGHVVLAMSLACWTATDEFKSCVKLDN